MTLSITSAGFAVVPFVARALVPTTASGWRILFAIGAVGGVTILFMRRGLPPSPRWLVAIIIIFGFIASMTIGLLVPMLYTYTAEHFSTAARATGVALGDGLGHIGGALAPLIVLGANIAWGFSGAFLVMAISGLLTGR